MAPRQVRVVRLQEATAGFLRRRFFRAVVAATVAFGPVWFALYVLGQLLEPDSEIGDLLNGLTLGDKAVLIGKWIGLAVAAIVVLLLAFNLLVMLLERVHRRISAALTLALGVGLIVALVIWSLQRFQDSAYSVVLTPLVYRLAWYGAVVLSFTLIAECLYAQWWQLTSERRLFLAVRGWRPPLLSFTGALRRMFGLPSFLTQIANNRTTLALVYFAVALLNMGVAALMLTPVVLDNLYGVFHLEFSSGLINAPDSYVADQLREAARIGSVAPSRLALIFVGLSFLLYCCGAGHWMLRLADGLATKAYQSVHDWDERAPILFLRSFEQDLTRLRCHRVDPLVGLPLGVAAAQTIDQVMLDCASPYGPVLAIGDPRNPIPPLGAARVFVQGRGEEWKDVVTSLADAAAAIILCPGVGEGVLWEQELIVGRNAQARAIYLANLDIPLESSNAVMSQIVGGANNVELDRDAAIVAAFLSNDGRWTVLSSRQRDVRAYTIALNYALQSLLGTEGVSMKRRRWLRPQHQPR